MLFPGDASIQGRHAGAYDPRTSRMRKFLIFLGVLVLLFLLAWPFIEPFMLQTETVALHSDDLPAGVGQLRIVYVTDIHKGGLYTDARLEALVSRINALNADLILLGGDYASDSAGAIEFFETLPRLYARYGVYAVLGNHDRTQPESNLNQLRRAMQDAHVKLLLNTVEPVQIGGNTIYIAGVDDVSCGHPDLTAVASQVRRQDYVIFLCHSPEIIPEALNTADRYGELKWFDLGLFGHTHGGQVALFGGLVRDSKVDEQYQSGWTKPNGIDLLTSRGVGTTLLPVRLFCRPQIHLITVNSGQ